MKKKLINLVVVCLVMIFGATPALANVSSESQQGTMQASVKLYSSAGILPTTATYQAHVPVVNFSTGNTETVFIQLVKNQDQYNLTIPMSDVTYQLAGKEIDGFGQSIYIRFDSLNGTPNCDLMFTLICHSNGNVNISGMKIGTVVSGTYYHGYIPDNMDMGWLIKI